MTELKVKLNDIAKSLYPPKMKIEVDVGKLLRRVVDSAKDIDAAAELDGLAGGGERRRRRRQLGTTDDFVLADGLFDMGFIPPSDRFGENPKGYGTACTPNCKEYKTLAEIEAEAARNKVSQKEVDNAERGLSREMIGLIVGLSLLVVVGSAVLVCKYKTSEGFRAKLTAIVPCGGCGKNQGGNKVESPAWPGAWTKSAWAEKQDPKEKRKKKKQKKDKGGKTVTKVVPMRVGGQAAPLRPRPPPQVAKTGKEKKAELARVRRQFGAGSQNYRDCVKAL